MGSGFFMGSGGFYGVRRFEEVLEDLQEDYSGMGSGFFGGLEGLRGFGGPTGGLKWDGIGVLGGSGGFKRVWRTYRRAEVGWDRGFLGVWRV